MKTISLFLLVLLCAAVHAADQPEPAVSVTYERMGCLGFCPAYKVTISSDGTVVYEGGKNVALPEPANKRVPASQVAPLFQKIRDLNFMMIDGRADGREMRGNGDVIGGIAYDAASYSITVVQDGRSKKVGGSPGGPYVERDLPDLIIKVADIAAWVKSINPLEGIPREELYNVTISPTAKTAQPASAPR
jgi:hypothetical protein